jgi:uncharacterized protein affecting Mg2+/Co2+ transport
LLALAPPCFVGFEVRVSVFLMPPIQQFAPLLCWAYRVRMRLLPEEESGVPYTGPLQLVARRWEIVRAEQVGNEHTEPEVVVGVGVIGLYPTFTPGERFEYASLTTDTQPGGCMRGHFLLRNLESKEQFSVEVPTFQMNYDSWPSSLRWSEEE